MIVQTFVKGLTQYCKFPTLNFGKQTCSIWFTKRGEIFDAYTIEHYTKRAFHQTG